MRTLLQDVDRVIASNPYKVWAAQHTIDAGKVTKERAGTQRPLPNDSYGRVLVEAIRRGHEQAAGGTPPPGPLPVSTIAPIWKLDACFTAGGLSNFAGAPRVRARQTGWQAVYVQLLNSGYADANEYEIPAFVSEGWLAVGWGTYGQNTDPEQDGHDAAELCKRLRVLKGFKANGEAWAEQEHAWKTGAFLKGWTSAGGPVPLGWSVLSSDTANFAREYDYPTALSAEGADIDCQVYGASYPSYTVGACNGMLDKARVPHERRTMSFDVNGNGDGPFQDYLTWAGPRRLWQPDMATVSTFDRLAR